MTGALAPLPREVRYAHLEQCLIFIANDHWAAWAALPPTEQVAWINRRLAPLMTGDNLDLGYTNAYELFRGLLEVRSWRTC